LEFKKFRLSKLGVFGSTARGEVSNDIDILIVATFLIALSQLDENEGWVLPALTVTPVNDILRIINMSIEIVSND